MVKIFSRLELFGSILLSFALIGFWRDVTFVTGRDAD